MWYEACMNPHAIERLYSSGQGLDRVELFELCLDREATHLQLRVQLPRFPDHPPARWGAEANAVQVTVSFWSIDDLRLEGRSGEAIGDLSLSREGERLRLGFASDTVRLSAWCELARIDRFSAYTDSPPEHAALPD